MNKYALGLLSVTGVLLSPIASAHVGGVHTHLGFSEGFIHPFSGLDHLTMLVAVGVLARQQIRAKAALMMTSTLALMVAGLALGSLFQFAHVELLVALSLFVAAISIGAPTRLVISNTAATPNVARQRVFNAASVGLVLFHGWAHGAEMSGSLLGFGSGMALASLTLMICGYGVAGFVPSRWLAKLTAACGLLVAFA